jgi:hypothetical protein
VILDVMPIDPNILGFGSDWYQEAQENAVRFVLPRIIGRIEAISKLS